MLLTKSRYAIADVTKEPRVTKKILDLLRNATLTVELVAELESFIVRQLMYASNRAQKESAAMLFMPRL
jgi:hypothetical protein